MPSGLPENVKYSFLIYIMIFVVHYFTDGYNSRFSCEKFYYSDWFIKSGNREPDANLFALFGWG